MAFDCNLLCLSETFLKKIHYEFVHLDSYNSANSYFRNYKCTGGTCVFVKNIIEYNKLDWLDDISVTKCFECCEIKLPRLNLL